MVAFRGILSVIHFASEIFVADLFSDFLNDPRAETYLRLRRALMGAPEYDPISSSLTEFAGLVDGGDHDAVRAAIPGLMSNFLLSPSAHFLMAASARDSGDTAGLDRETTMAQACLHAIADTGEGTAQAPYRCVHVSDEYDLAGAMGHTVATQRSEVRDGRFHDVLVFDDGTEMHFDVTEIMAVMAEG
jgi:hypothetical protein